MSSMLPHRRKKWLAGILAFLPVVLPSIFVTLSLVTICVVYFNIRFAGVSRPVLRISDWKTGEVYTEHHVSRGDELYFGWIHSLEKIPWDEYYHIDDDLNLILDTIRFPAFGAGIPENKGSVCYIEDGLIYMSGINQKFTEFDWMNSHTATQEIRVAGEYVTRGSELPAKRLVLNIKEK